VVLCNFVSFEQTYLFLVLIEFGLGEPQATLNGQDIGVAFEWFCATLLVLSKLIYFWY